MKAYKHPIACNGLRALPQAAIERATEKTRAVLLDRGIKPKGLYYDLEKYLQILAVATGKSRDMLSLLYLDEVYTLFDRWQEIQNKSLTDV